MNSYSTIPLSEISLKDKGEGKSSHWIEIKAVLLAVHFAWNKK